MNQNFDKCMEMLLHHEGGFVNHPSDPGAMTNLGVTKSTWDHFYGDDIDEERIRNITVDDVKPLYKTNYWDRCRCGDLPSGVDWAVFD
jgi:lysozyme family protein